MRFVKLGSTGMDVSAVCLGCMSFGEPDKGNQSWSLPDADARPILRRAVEAAAIADAILAG